MPSKTDSITDTISVLGVAFVVGIIAQYLRQKTDETVTNHNIFWLSLASGFSAMVAIGILDNYTEMSGGFLVSMSGLAGWAGISILSTLSRSFDQLLIRTAEKKLDVKINYPVPTAPTPTSTEGVNEEDGSITTTMGSQTE